MKNNDREHSAVTGSKEPGTERTRAVPGHTTLHPQLFDFRLLLLFISPVRIKIRR